jgi:hypothetical protein
MAKHYRKMIVHSDHLETPESGPPWTVLWDTNARGDDRWSTVRTQTEAAALERAGHFVKLGFVVHAIKDPSGAVVMNSETIAARFGATEERKPRRPPDGAAPSAEKSAQTVMRAVVEDFHGRPGRVLAASAVHALLAPQGLSPAEFAAALSYAEERGWLRAANESLTLTQAGYAVATA